MNAIKVCWLETDFRLMWNMKAKKGEGGCRSKNFLMYCSMCKIYAHTKRPNLSHQIFSIPEFEKLTCFEIIHHPLCDGLISPETGTKKNTTINKKHKLFSRLMAMYIQKYGEPVISMQQLAKKKNDKRKAADARRKRVEKSGGSQAGNCDIEEDCEEVDPDETDDDDDYDYFEPVTEV